MAEQEFSHPLKWEYLKQIVEERGLINPDIWIEDLRNYGPCIGVKTTVVCESEGTEGVEASFSVISDKKHNRIIIRHHF